MVANYLEEQRLVEKMNQSISSINGHIYPLIKGSNYYCVPTCLRMVMASMNFFFSEIEIMNYFHLHTADDTDNEKLFGICVKNGDLDYLFSRIDVPLTEEFIPISHIIDFQFTDVIHQLLIEGKHIICGYSYGLLYKKPELKEIGHVSIIIDNDEKYITIINPGPENFGINRVKEDDLYDAIRTRSDGLWVLIPG